MAPLADVPEFTNLLTMFKNPVLGVLAGALLTAIIQSSSASVGILQALSVTGGFTFGTAIPIILGQNIGTCVTAMISAIGANKGAKRTAFVHLYFNMIGTVLFLCLFYLGNAIFRFPFTNDVVNAADIALVHSIFNVFTTLVLLPFTKGLEKLAYLTIPKTEDEKKTANDAFVILDDRFLSSPAFAIEQCRSLVSQMAEMTRDGFLEAMDVLGEYSEEKAQDVIDKENRVDVYDDKITAYLTKLSSENLSYKDSLQVTSLLHCITDFERISDHSINVVESVQQMRKGSHPRVNNLMVMILRQIIQTLTAMRAQPLTVRTAQWLRINQRHDCVTQHRFQIQHVVRTDDKGVLVTFRLLIVIDDAFVHVRFLHNVI